MINDLKKRLAKIEARQRDKPKSRDELESALTAHMAALEAEHGEEWESLYRDELLKRDPELLAMWDRVVPKMANRQKQNDALFQHISGGLKAVRDAYRRANRGGSA